MNTEISEAGAIAVPAAPARTVRVWDLPTRVFHWTLALSFAGAFLTGDSERYRDLHLMFGYTVAGLVAFRLLWGLVGSRYARFTSFLFPLERLRDYLRSLLAGSPRHYAGHNPAGALAIFLLLGLCLVAAASGFATYRELGGEWLEELHEGVANTLLAVVCIHLAGVLVSSLLHRENLAAAMVTGRKRGEPGEAISRAWAGLGIFLLAAVLAFWWAWLA